MCVCVCVCVCVCACFVSLFMYLCMYMNTCISIHEIIEIHGHNYMPMHTCRCNSMGKFVIYDYEYGQSCKYVCVGVYM